MNHHLPACFVASTLIFATTGFSQTFTEAGETLLGGYGGNARSGSFADIDNDGDPDLLIQGSGSGANIARRLFRNMTVETGSPSFTDITPEAGIIASDTTGWSAAWGDYDGDGFADVFLGETNPSSANGDLFHNNGDRTFTDVSASTIPDPGFHQNVAWNDADLDGDLDLLIGMEGPEPHELYVQNSDGSFTKSGESAGLWVPYASNRFGKAYGLAIGDYDRDGDYDLYVSTCRAGDDIPNNFFRSLFAENGMPVYEDLADLNGTQFRDNSYGTEFIDFDDDGWPDLYMTGADSRETKIWRNDQDGTWTDLATLLGHPVLPFAGGDFNGSKAVDYDNDTDLDLYFHDHLAANGADSARSLFRNDGGGAFVEVTGAEGLSAPNEGGYDSAWADFDLDGDMDLFAATGSGAPERFFVSSASENGNHWLHVRPRIPSGNTRAIGAALFATIHAGTLQERTLRREANTNAGTFNQSDVPVHFGLGAATMVDQLVIQWPGGGVDVYKDIAADQIITLTRGEGSGIAVY